jgi:PAS domain S-box-containing protein
LKSIKEVSEFAEDIIDTVREPLVVLDKDLRVVIANRSFYDFFKVIHGETIGTLIYDLGNKQWNIPKLRELLEIILPEKTSFDNYEVEHIFTTIGRRIMLLNARIIQRGSGKEQVFLLAFEDITGRKLAEEAFNISDTPNLIKKHKQIEVLLRESEEKYRILAELSPEMIYLVDLNGYIIFLNKAGASQFRVNPSEIVGKHMTDVFPEDNAIRNLTAIQKVINTNTPSYSETEITFPFGKIWMSTRLSPVCDNEYRVVSVLGLSIDITERKLLEESIKKQKDDFETIFNLVPAQIWYKDTNNNFIRVNKQVSSDIGMPIDKIEGHSAEELFPSFASQYFKDDLEVLNARKPKLGIVEKVNTAGGEIRWVNSDKIPVFGRNGEVTGLIAVVQDITGLKKSEEALRNSETRLRTLVHTIPDLIWLKDVNGVYLSCNKMFERFFGAGESDIVGKTDFDFINRNLADFFLEHDRKAMAAGKPTSNEEWIIFADDGHRAFLETIKTPMYDPQGTIIGILGIGRDITERKLSEKVIRDSEKRFRAIFDQAPIAIALLDMNGLLIISNSTLSKMVGYSNDELSKMKFTDFTYPEDIDTDMNQFIDLIDGKISNYKMEKRYVHKNGNIIWANIRVTILRDENGISHEIIGMAEDITERKHAEDKLQESEKRYKELTTLLPQSVFESDMNGVITFANDFVTKTFGFDKEEVLNKLTLQEMVIPEEKEYLLENIKIFFSNAVTIGREYTLLRKDGTTFPALVYSNPIIRSGKPVGIRGVLIDISEIKKTETELIKAKEKAESANKLKDAFIANISHEIRTPLNGILGMSSLIKEIFPGTISKDNEELFDGIDYSSQRLIRTVDMILNYSRLQVGEFPLFIKNIELSSLCVKLVTEFTTAARKKLLDITFLNNYGNAKLFADRYSIIMAVSNLIDNAIKYTRKGFIKVILHRGVKDEIMIDIIDTGIGINKESLENIFEPYRQVQMGYGRAYEGIGLGLSLVKKVLTLNKASIAVKSIVGEGTTFSINFGKAVKSI